MLLHSRGLNNTKEDYININTPTNNKYRKD